MDLFGLMGILVVIGCVIFVLFVVIGWFVMFIVDMVSYFFCLLFYFCELG